MHLDAANTLILVCGFLLVVSILAGIISNRLGAPILLVFLVVGMLAGTDGVLGLSFDSPNIAFFIGAAFFCHVPFSLFGIAVSYMSAP